MHFMLKVWNPENSSPRHSASKSDNDLRDYHTFIHPSMRAICLQLNTFINYQALKVKYMSE